MTEYVSSIVFIDNDKPVFETTSELDGKIVAWDEDTFACLLSVGQQKEVVFVADEAQDLMRIGKAMLNQNRPRLCLIERKFFESHFDSETVRVGVNVTDE